MKYASILVLLVFVVACDGRQKVSSASDHVNASMSPVSAVDSMMAKASKPADSIHTSSPVEDFLLARYRALDGRKTESQESFVDLLNTDDFCTPEQAMHYIEVAKTVEGTIGPQAVIDSTQIWIHKLGLCQDDMGSGGGAAVLFRDSVVSLIAENCRFVMWTMGSRALPFGITKNMELAAVLDAVPREKLVGFWAKDSLLKHATAIQTLRGNGYFDANFRLTAWKYFERPACQ